MVDGVCLHNEGDGFTSETLHSNLHLFLRARHMSLSASREEIEGHRSATMHVTTVNPARIVRTLCARLETSPEVSIQHHSSVSWRNGLANFLHRSLVSAQVRRVVGQRRRQCTSLPRASVRDGGNPLRVRRGQRLPHCELFLAPKKKSSATARTSSSPPNDGNTVNVDYEEPDAVAEQATPRTTAQGEMRPKENSHRTNEEEAPTQEGPEPGRRGPESDYEGSDSRL